MRVKIEDGVIVAVETGAAARDGDERHAIMIPAAANLHSHAFQRPWPVLPKSVGLGSIRSGRGARPCTDFPDDVAGQRRGRRR